MVTPRHHEAVDSYGREGQIVRVHASYGDKLIVVSVEERRGCAVVSTVHWVSPGYDATVARERRERVFVGNDRINADRELAEHPAVVPAAISIAPGNHATILHEEGSRALGGPHAHRAAHVPV